MRARQRPNGRPRAKSQSELTLSVEGAPTTLPPHISASSLGMVPDSFVALAGRLVQMRLGGSESGINQWSRCHGPAAIFHCPGLGCAYLTTAALVTPWGVGSVESGAHDRSSDQG